jgi:hypothetical protein
VYALTYTYSRPQLRHYFRHELWRKHGGFLLAVPLALAAVVWGSLDHDYWWFAGFLAGMILSYVLLLYTSYRRLDTFPVGVPMTTTLSESGIHFDSALLVSDVPWSTIRTVRRVTDGLVLTSRTTRHPVLLPSTVLNQEIVAFVERKVKQGRAGGDDGA